MAPSDDAEGEVEHGEVAGRLLLPADQDAAEAVEPRMGAFHDPAPRPGAGVALGLDLLAARAQVEREAEFGGEPGHLGIVVALVEAEALRRLRRRRRPLDRDRLDGLAHELVVVAVGAIGREPERDPATVRQQAPLGPALAPVGRVRAGFFPHPEAPCPWLRPAPASPTRSRPARRRPAGRGARTHGTRRPRPTPGSAGGPRRTSRCR